MKLKHRDRILQSIAVLGIATIGFLAIHASSASQNPAPAVEPESVVGIGNGSVLSDGSASAGKAVSFGEATYGPQPATKPANVVTPEQYGAVGNGTSDDTSFVQQALDNGAGKTVWLSSKTYLITSTLTIDSNTKLLGAGPKAVLKFNWFYILGSGSPGHYLKNKHVSGDSNLTFSNFVIEGASDGLPSGIDSQNPYTLAGSLRLGNVINSFTIAHLEVRNTPGLSISYHGAQNGVISYNYVHNSGRDGITGFWAPGTAGTNTNITITHNYVNKTGDDMIAINGLPTDQFNNQSIPSNITVTDNTVENWYTDPNGKALGRGIVFVGVRSGLIQHNSIINTAANNPGILLTGTWGIFGNMGSYDPALCTNPPAPIPANCQWISANVTVKDNTIHNAGQLPGIGPTGHGSGILTDTTRDSTITGNRIINTKVPYLPLRNDGCNINCTITNNPTN